jgi:hypothetical protein
LLFCHQPKEKRIGIPQSLYDGGFSSCRLGEHLQGIGDNAVDSRKVIDHFVTDQHVVFPSPQTDIHAPGVPPRRLTSIDMR